MAMILDINKLRRLSETQTTSSKIYPTPQTSTSHRGLMKLSGFDETIKALRNTRTAITLTLARTIAAIGVDILVNSLPITPIETGELRESGRATVKIGRINYTVGMGSAEGTVRANLAAFMAKDLKGTKTLYLDVSYKKIEDGLDIALWLHEDLLHYDKRPAHPAARTPGTGPKYLSNPWEEKKLLYSAWIANTLSPSVISQNIALAKRVTKRKVGKYEVDITNIDPDKVGWRAKWLTR